MAKVVGGSECEEIDGHAILELAEEYDLAGEGEDDNVVLSALLLTWIRHGATSQGLTLSDAQVLDLLTPVSKAAVLAMVSGLVGPS